MQSWSLSDVGLHTKQYHLEEQLLNFAKLQIDFNTLEKINFKIRYLKRKINNKFDIIFQDTFEHTVFYEVLVRYDLLNNDSKVYLGFDIILQW